jgi:NADH:ubiquinone reductase (H+-translocating)
MEVRMVAEREHVVIVGAGFAGLQAARDLAGKPLDVTVVDRHDYHLFQPLLYQVATGKLEPQTAAYALRRIIRKMPNVNFRMAEATGVDLEEQLVEVSDGPPLRYDHLILAVGATTNTLGIEGVREHCYPMKTLEDAERMRDHILACFEHVSAHPQARDIEASLTFVIVGGGPTGVELAGALADLIRDVLDEDFPELAMEDITVLLVEALPHVLSPFEEKNRDYARRSLEDRGIQVRLETALESVSEGHVHLPDDEVIRTETILWTAGVRAQPLADRLGLKQVGNGQILVDDDLSVPEHPNVWVAGDLAGATDPDGDPYPQLAPVAMQQGSHVVRQIAKRRRGEPTEPFQYTDKGIMATLGRGSGIAELPIGPSIRGRLAWFAWLGAHVGFLVGVRNRLLTVINWVYAHFFRQRAARMIIRGSEAPRATPAEDVESD